MNKQDKRVIKLAKVTFMLIASLTYSAIFIFGDNKKLFETLLITALGVSWVFFLPYSIYMVRKMNRVYYLHKYRIFGTVIVTALYTLFTFNLIYNYIST